MTSNLTWYNQCGKMFKCYNTYLLSSVIIYICSRIGDVKIGNNGVNDGSSAIFCISEEGLISSEKG